MSQPPELSRRYLSDTGGWKEMKEARAIHAAGRVEEARYENGVLEGLVRDKGKSMKVRMTFRSRIDVENACPCYRARREGIICAHGLAVGLEVLEPTEKKASPAAGASSKAGEAKKKAAPKVSEAWPRLSELGSDTVIDARLHLVLAPRLAEAWSKGRITVGVEIESDGERRLLKSLQADEELFLDASDTALYRVLQEISPEQVPGMLNVATHDLAKIFAAVPGHRGITLGKTDSLTIAHLPYRPTVRRGKGLRFQVEWNAAVVPLVSTEGVWVLAEKNLVQPVAPGLASRWQCVMVGGLTLTPQDFLEGFAALQRHFDLEEVDVRRVSPEVVLEVEGSLNHLDAELSFRYGSEEVAASVGREPVREKGGSLEIADIAKEEAAIDRLEEVGFQRRGAGGRWVLKDKEAILQFLAHGLPQFEKDFQIETGERFEHARSLVEPIETTLEFRPGGEDWFALDVAFGTSSGNSVSRQEIERLLQMGQSSQPLPKGKVAVLEKDIASRFSEVLSDCDPEQIQAGTYRIDQAQAGYLEETAKDFGFRSTGALPWQNEVEGIEFYDLSESLESTLRPYQKEGFTWMQDLASKGMGGILADDMGLGKTLQTISFLYSVGGTSLVVCPSSLVFNWVAEVEKFAPDLEAVAIEGPNRSKVLKAHPEADVYVTSYALLRRDEEVWAERDFDVVVLDEAQHIKNPEAQVSRAAHRLRGTHRFVLTGTPIENSVRDLWSISQFALPGYLGSRKDFAERFEKPLSSSDPPVSVRERLSRRLRPVLLRRLKQEVAKDLPEKIEQVVYCDLKPQQREVYEKLLRESKASLLEAEGGKQRMLALTALLRLRQTCCDLRLLGLSEVEEREASIKSDALHELLEEAIEGGHRVLIFSQFVEMLQILVPDLAGKGIDFCYLDGQTRNRGEVVRKFQEEDVPVFLISLKAGGVGLNLAAADTVIHIDPWWNPAVEAQATDRAHRIGQEKVVTSYKLITRGTVEEKILALQNRKREMTESLLSEAGDTSLSASELMSLFD